LSGTLKVIDSIIVANLLLERAMYQTVKPTTTAVTAEMIVAIGVFNEPQIAQRSGVAT